MSAFDDFLTDAVNDSINARPFDQDLDEAFDGYVEPTGGTESTQSDTAPNRPGVDAFCALEFALRCVLWLTIAGVMAMFLSSIALTN